MTKSLRPTTLRIGKLKKGFPCISRPSGIRLSNAAAICLESQSHEIGVMIGITNDNHACSFMLHWPETTDQLQREWADPQEATESGAVAIAILLVDLLTDYQVIERAYKTTGIDYWLGLKTALLLQKAARLEVSGIRKGDMGKVNHRVKAKLNQSQQSRKSQLPVIVTVVEFSSPLAVMVKQ